jgi:DNA-binding LytR/AlgR family response regulator
MKPVRVLLAEDEAPQREALLSLLREVWPEARVVATCADGLEALEAFERERPQVAFLDIRMPGLSGLEVAATLSGRAHLVFVTAYDDYAVRAFEQGAVDYLLKPLGRERFAAAVQRLKGRIQEPPPSVSELLTRLRLELRGEGRSETLKWITASLGSTVKLYSIGDVLAFHAQDKYTHVITRSDEATIRKSLRELMLQLDSEEFWQVHRAVVVRASAIDCVMRDQLGKHWLSLKGHPGVLPVSAAFQARFRGM